jgi:HD superfamily phosphohydrolase
MKDEERIRCPVHNLISFKKSDPDDILLWELIQTRPMQRLRRIKQLGFSEFVYPGATHTRFSHVVGAMQMARRMLAVLQRNQSFENDEETKADRRATLAAALLHDIGHGPYSHVFEELCGHFSLKKSHEEYALELLRSGEIAEILERHGVLEKTIHMFEKEPGLSVFNAIISSQLDCDRLDFLSRDRLHTGIKSAKIDLEWLFDSLRIEQTPIDEQGATKAYSFVFLAKGLSVAEEYVLSYVKMYNTVYFHKTTRGVQHLVRDLMIEVITNHSDNQEISGLPVIRFFKGERDLNAYLALDDSSIQAITHIAASNDWGRASNLAVRFLDRNLYKCFELPNTEAGTVPRARLDRFKQRLNESRIRYIDDIVSQRSLKHYDVTNSSFLMNILIRQGSEIEALGNVSSIVRAPARRVARLYFENREDRDRAEELFRTS